MEAREKKHSKNMKKALSAHMIAWEQIVKSIGVQR